MNSILEKLEECGFKISTDTRKDVSGTVFFALKGENFDANVFAPDAVKNGAVAVVVDNPKITGGKIHLVDDVTTAFQKAANAYRKLFNIPIIVIGGSNGKTTSKELVREVLKTKYRVHATEGNLNSQTGVPSSIFALSRDSELAVFEIGANHPQEHTILMETIEPTAVVVTNNGLDHLEGFGSPEGVRRANREIYDWARSHSVTAFVNKNHSDLMEDSEGLGRVFYPNQNIEVTSSTPLAFRLGGKEYTTNLAGKYNVENISLALALGKHFGVDEEAALRAISEYQPSIKRSEILKRDGVEFIVDCYNANPSSMMAALESFVESAKNPRGVILGDMLELGDYADTEHAKIVDYVGKQDFKLKVFVGETFKKALSSADFEYLWFPDSEKAREWFRGENLKGFTILVKGSRGLKLEKILDM